MESASSPPPSAPSQPSPSPPPPPRSHSLPNAPPRLFAGEVVVRSEPNVSKTTVQGGAVQLLGSLHLTNFRLVFVAANEDAQDSWDPRSAIFGDEANIPLRFIAAISSIDLSAASSAAPASNDMQTALGVNTKSKFAADSNGNNAGSVSARSRSSSPTSTFTTSNSTTGAINDYSSARRVPSMYVNSKHSSSGESLTDSTKPGNALAAAGISNSSNRNSSGSFVNWRNFFSPGYTKRKEALTPASNPVLLSTTSSAMSLISNGMEAFELDLVDMRRVRFNIMKAPRRESVFISSSSSSSSSSSIAETAFADLLFLYAFPRNCKLLFPFELRPMVLLGSSEQEIESEKFLQEENQSKSSWHYDPVVDFDRMKLESTGWTLSNINGDFQMCETYPRLLCFPSSIPAPILIRCAQLRRMGRIPTLSYHHVLTGRFLLRSSAVLQAAHSCHRDLLRSIALLPLQDPSMKLIIFRLTENIDTFDSQTASSSSATESSSYYPPSHAANTLSSLAEIDASLFPFANFENHTALASSSLVSPNQPRRISSASNPHVMLPTADVDVTIYRDRCALPSLPQIQDAYDRMVVLCGEHFSFSDLPDSGHAGSFGGIDAQVEAKGCKDDSHWLSDLNSTLWLQFVQDFLAAANRVVQWIDHERVTVMLEGVSNLDRTAIIASLSQIMMDPFCRTVEGFLQLIQKEWIFSGHPFSSRMTHISTPFTTHGVFNTPTSPVDDDSGIYSHLNGGDASSFKDAHAEGIDSRAGSSCFILFFDCVHQLIQMYPQKFEFNERLLTVLLGASRSCFFGDFIGDSERHRAGLGLISSSPSSSLPEQPSLHRKRNYASIIDFLNFAITPQERLVLLNPAFRKPGERVNGYGIASSSSSISSGVIQLSRRLAAGYMPARIVARFWFGHFARWRPRYKDHEGFLPLHRSNNSSNSNHSNKHMSSIYGKTWHKEAALARDLVRLQLQLARIEMFQKQQEESDDATQQLSKEDLDEIRRVWSEDSYEFNHCMRVAREVDAVWLEYE